MPCNLYPTDVPDYESLNRILGQPVGVASNQWPLFEGRPGQHLMTLDLATVPSGILDTKSYRAVAIFISSLIDNDANIPASGETQVVWISQAEIDRYGETQPPTDWCAEFVEAGSQTFDVGPAIDVMDDISDNYIGGIPLWSQSLEHPQQSPEGRFMMRLSSLDFPFAPFPANLFVFEDDAFWQAEEDVAAPPAWRDLLSVVRQLVVYPGETGNLENRLDYYGGLPPCGDRFSWPTSDNGQPLTHVFTLDTQGFFTVAAQGRLQPLDEGVAAISLFYDPTWQGQWGKHTPYRVVFLGQDDLNRDRPLQVPRKADVLPTARIERQQVDLPQSRTVLSHLSLISPRPAWRVLEPDPMVQSFLLQMASNDLPTSPETGTLYLYYWYDPRWQGVSQLPGQIDDENEADSILIEPFGESMDDEQLDHLRDQIRILTLGDGSAGFVGGIPPGIDGDRWPMYRDRPMTHILTLYTAAIPGLRHLPYAGVVLFLSSASNHEAFFPGSPHAAVVLLNQSELATPLIEVPLGAEALPRRGVQARPLPVNMRVATLATKTFAGGAPIWLQEPNGDAEGFILQINDDLIDINLADNGTLYVYDYSAWLQSL